MIVEIHGAGFHNRGAELMQLAVVDALRRRLESFEPALDAAPARVKDLLGLPIIRIVPPRGTLGAGFRRRFLRQKLLPALFRSGLEVPGITTIANCEALLDISGFLHTDYWQDVTRTRNFSTLTRFYSVRSRPVVLLPQAFGPFTNPPLRTAFRRLMPTCTLIFARDPQSMHYIEELSPIRDNLRLAPDITLCFPPAPTPPHPFETSYVCIIPSARLLDVGAPMWADHYYDYILGAASLILQQGIPVRLLEHESSGGDRAIIHRLESDLHSPLLTTVLGAAALDLKRIIWDARFVIGSRYHSLAAAFSGSVPSIGLGWCHKYDGLYDDFHCSELLFSSTAPFDDFERLIMRLLDNSHNANYRATIAQQMAVITRDSEEMWDSVAKILSRGVQKPSNPIRKLISLID